MPKLPGVRHQDALRVFEKLGYRIIRQSGHRHVIQQRLKLAGCWWKETHAQAMLNLRVARANNLWNSYWSKN